MMSYTNLYYTKLENFHIKKDIGISLVIFKNRKASKIPSIKYIVRNF